MRKLVCAAVLALSAGVPPLAAADPLGEALVLVARPQLNDPLYARTVLVVAPFGENQHYGFIVNRPTRHKLGEMFPGHAPSQKVADPVFLGGPFDLRIIFALVPQAESPGPGSMELTPGLYAAFNARTVDRIIETKPDDARFVTGLVVWRPGELAHELAGRMWYLLGPDASLATREPHGMWEELAARAQRYGRLLRSARSSASGCAGAGAASSTSRRVSNSPHRARKPHDARAVLKCDLRGPASDEAAYPPSANPGYKVIPPSTKSVVPTT